MDLAYQRRLAGFNDAFASLRDNGGGQRMLPAIIQQQQQQEQFNKAREAYQQAQQGGGLPMGFDSPAMQAYAAQNPQQALQLAAQRSIAPEAQPDPWKGTKVVGGNVLGMSDNGIETLYSAPQAEKERRIVEGADGRKYYADTQEPVLSNVSAGPKIDPKAEGELRKEFTGLTKDYRAVRDAFTRIDGASKRDTPAGDLAMIFNYMKMLDPGSVVRESEFAVAANAAPLLERMGISWDKVSAVWAGQRLTPGVRTDFITTAGELFGKAEGQYAQTRDQYRGLAGQYGFDPKRAIPDFERPNVSAAPSAPTGPRKTIGGVTYEQRNGKWGIVQ